MTWNSPLREDTEMAHRSSLWRAAQRNPGTAQLHKAAVGKGDIWPSDVFCYFSLRLEMLSSWSIKRADY